MKNLKKVLALAVAFVMCFTMFAGALVFTDVPAGGDYSAAITLLSDLGVVAGKPDGSFGINDAITRADAACLIARLMTGEQNPPKYNNAPVFSDVVPGSYYESSVGYCAAMGITSGTGNGKFSPSNTITDGEFVAMLTRALGYDTPEHPLQWPMGNIVVAQQKGLLKNVNIEYASDALRGEDAQMLANALFADYDAAAARKNLYQRADDVDQHITIAEEVFNLGRLAFDADYNSNDNRAVDFFRAEKKVYNDGKNSYNVAEDCQAHTWVIAGVDAHEKENTYVAYAIDDDDNKVVQPTETGKGWAYQTFTYTGDVTPFIGYQVELWGNMDHTGNTIEVDAIRTVEGQSVYDYNASMDGDDDEVKVDDQTLKLKDADAGMATLRLKKDNWQTDDSISGFQNNWNGAKRVDRVYDLNKGHKDGVNAKDLRIKDGDQFKLYDWDSDGDVDFVVRNTAKYAMVEDITAKRLVIAGINEDKDADKAAKDGDNTTTSLKLGESDLVINAEGIEEGDIVEITVDSRVYTKADDEVVTISVNKVEPDTHKLTKVSTKGDLASFFDGEEFYVANGGFWDLTEAKDPEDYKYEESDIKRDFDLFLDRNGFIVYSRYSNGDSAKYMLIMETQDGGGRISAHHLPTIKALLENDKVETFDTIEKLKIYQPNGTSLSTGYNSSNFTFTQPDVVGRVYKYYTNSKGEITKLVEAFDDTTVTDTGRNRTAILDDYSFNEKSISMLDTVGATGRYNFEKAKAVFVVKTPHNEDNDVATYVRKHGTGDNAYWYVAREDVIAVDPDDIPNIAEKANPGSGVNAEVLANATLTASKKDLATTYAVPKYDTDEPFASYSSWVHTGATGPAAGTGADKAAYIGYTNDNRDVSAALIGVDDFDGFGRNSVKLGILKRVDSDASEKDDEYVYTFHLAVDGKEIAEYKSDSVEGLSEIMRRIDGDQSLAMTSKDDIDQILEDRGLAYVEVRFDGDLVDEIVVMDTADGGHLYNGEYYSVTRAVVGSNKINNVVQFNDTDVTFSSDKEFNSILNERASAYNAGLTADTNYYAIGERPTVASKNYNGTTLKVTNDFEDDYNVAAAEKTDINYSSISNSNVNDEYYVVDIATEKVVDRDKMNGKDAVAVVIFEDQMGENPVGSTNTGTTVPGSKVAVNVPNIPYDDVIPGSLSIRYGGASADRTITNYAPNDVEYAKLLELSGDATAVEVKFTDKARLGRYVVEGDTKKNGTFTVTITVGEPDTSAFKVEGSVAVADLDASASNFVSVRDTRLVETLGLNKVGKGYDLSSAADMAKKPVLKSIQNVGGSEFYVEVVLNGATYEDGDTITFTDVKLENGRVVTIVLNVTSDGNEPPKDPSGAVDGEELKYSNGGWGFITGSKRIRVRLGNPDDGYDFDDIENEKHNWLTKELYEEIALQPKDIKLDVTHDGEVMTSYPVTKIDILEANDPSGQIGMFKNGTVFLELFIDGTLECYTDDVVIVKIKGDKVVDFDSQPIECPILLDTNYQWGTRP